MDLQKNVQACMNVNSSTYIYLPQCTFFFILEKVGNLKLYRCDMLRSETECCIVPQCVAVLKFFVFPDL
jgi:hypothetical protein